MIELEDVSYTYAAGREAALTRVTLQVAAGELKVLTGPSGCGKTTVMRVVNGLIPHLLGGTLTGRVAVAGEEPQRTSLVALSSVVGTLFQDPEEQFFALNVHDEIAFTLKSRGVAPAEIEARVAEAAARLGIESILERDIHALSEGQKQNVGLASLLVLRPKVLVLDEPSANLDPEATEELAELLRALKESGTAILVVDHRLYWLKDVADEVLVMRAGQIVARGDWSMLTEPFCAEHGLRAPVVGDVRETLASVPVWHGSEVARIAPANARFGAQNLSFGYSAEEPLFHEVSFSVPAGITALIGANGEGKTTLARVLTGLNKAQGQFIVGTAVSDAAGLLARAGLVLQNADHQLQMRTVREEIATAHAVGRTLKEAQKRFPRVCEEDWAAAEQWMAALNLAGLGERHPQSLSGGQKQRVVIACALAKSPDILILDEPTSGLDGANMHDIAAVLRSAADRGVAVFLITHDLELLTICDAALRIRELRSTFTNNKDREHD